jgi:hypothetical protein
MSEVILSSSSPTERPEERSDSFIDDDVDFVKLFVGQVSINSGYKKYPSKLITNPIYSKVSHLFKLQPFKLRSQRIWMKI